MKKVMNTIYVHKDYVNVLQARLQCVVERAKDHLPRDFEYEVVKLDARGTAVSFTQSPDWCTSSEPSVGNSYRVARDGTVKLMKGRGQIYHHKWQFVDVDYTDFDYEASKAWSELWESKLPRTREVKSRIGYLKYWKAILAEYDLEK